MKPLAYGSVVMVAGGNMFEVIVLLNSPSTGPTRPFLGGLTSNGNVKIVHPGYWPAMCLHARSWLCLYSKGMLFEVIVLLITPYTRLTRQFLWMMIMVSPWWEIVHCYSRRPIYKATCLWFYCYGGGNIFQVIVLLNSPPTGLTAPLYWMMGCLARTTFFCDGYLVVVWLMALVSYLCGAFISGWCCCPSHCCCLRLRLLLCQPPCLFLCHSGYGCAPSIPLPIYDGLWKGIWRSTWAPNVWECQ